MAAKARKRPAAPAKRSNLWRRLIVWAVRLVLGALAFFSFTLLLLRWVDPWFTGVQLQRRAEALFRRERYVKRHQFVPLARISQSLQHAVIAAEDSRFFQHHGIDWQELGKVVEEDLEEGRLGRGASTITQQLMKNLYMTTQRSWLRKGLEFALAPLAELILPKRRILELYLNVIEWGPGVFGAEAAARYHYGVGAARIGREQAARLAACIPSPRRRKPQRMNAYSTEILARMDQMGW